MVGEGKECLNTKFYLFNKIIISPPISPSLPLNLCIFGPII